MRSFAHTRMLLQANNIEGALKPWLKHIGLPCTARSATRKPSVHSVTLPIVICASSRASNDGPTAEETAPGARTAADFRARQVVGCPHGSRPRLLEVRRGARGAEPPTAAAR